MNLLKHGLPADFGPDHRDWKMASKQSRYWDAYDEEHPIDPGRTCIFTVVDDKYAAFVPMFVYCAKKVYPEYGIRISVVNPNVSLDSRMYGKSAMVENIYGADQTPLFPATLRFLEHILTLEGFDNTFITDIDLLMFRESPPLAEQHLRSMRRQGLQCYDNYVVDGRMPGCHFVTRDWWARTAKAREEILVSLDPKSLQKEDDERLLFDIVKRSGLPWQGHTPNLWATHGLHLGRFRDKKHRDFHLDANEQALLREILVDPVFLDLARRAAEKIDWLGEVIDRLKNEVLPQPKKEGLRLAPAS